MMEITKIGALAGFASIITPAFVFLQHFAFEFRKFKLEKNSLSHSSLRYKNKLQALRVALFLNGLWSYILFWEINRYLRLSGVNIDPINPIPLILLILFLVSAVDLRRKSIKQHYVVASILGIILWITKIVYGIYFFNINTTVAYISLIIAFFDSLVIGLPILRSRHVTTGFNQILFCSLLSIWVFAFSVYLLLI